jgi:hypothetical protein
MGDRRELWPGAALPGAPPSLFRGRAFALFWGGRLFCVLAVRAEGATIGWQVYLLRPEIRAGIAGKGVLALPVPSAQQIAWTSADDAALATLALFDNEAFGRDCLVSGPECVDGEGLARALSEALRRDIEFQSLPLEALERQIDSAMGAGVGNRVTSKFRFFEAHPDEADKMLSPPFEPCRALSGFIPTAIRAWASERRSSFS